MIEVILRRAYGREGNLPLIASAKGVDASASARFGLAPCMSS